MSKRSTANEWSDDDIEDTDGSSGSPAKRHRKCEESEQKESSESGNTLLKSLYNCCTSLKTFSSSTKTLINKTLKVLNFKTNDRQMNCESETSGRRIGMNQINDSLALNRFNTSTDSMSFGSNPNLSYAMNQTPNNCQQNNYKFFVNTIPNPIPNINASNASTYYVINQSPQQSGSVISLSPPVFQIVQSSLCANTSPTPSVVLYPTGADIDHNVDQRKCQACGQLSASPVIRCHHCGFGRLPSNPNASTAPIPTKKFYKSESESDLVRGLGRGRARMPMNNISFSSPLSRPMNTINVIRSTANARTNGPIAYLHQLSGQSEQRQPQNPECIDLDEEIIEVKSHSTQESQSTNELSDECIEIMDTNRAEGVVDNEVGVQCNFEVKNEIKSSSDESMNETTKQRENEEKEESLVFPIVSYPEYLMFGTYRTEAKSVEFTADGLKLTNVAPNSLTKKNFKYHIMIPFVEMKQLLYCTAPFLPVLFVRPTKESNDKIQDCMDLGKTSPNGHKFDINSKETREQFITIKLKEKIGGSFVRALNRCSQTNSLFECKEILLDRARRLLEKTQNRLATNNSEQRLEQVIKSSAMTTPPNRYTNPYKSPKASTETDSSSSSQKNHSSNRRSLLNKSQTPVQTVILIDDDEEDVIEAKSESESNEFEKVILSYPDDEENAIQLIGTDIICLNRGEFLNDNIVNFYLRYYMKQTISEDMRQRTHIFDTLFFMQLTEKRPAKRKNTFGREDQYTFEQRYNQKLKSWTKNIDLFCKDFLIFPIIRESHWFLAIVCYPKSVLSLQQKCDKTSAQQSVQNEKRPCIIFMDSLGNAGYKKQLSQPIRDFLGLEWKEKKGSELSFKAKQVMKDFFPRVPNQTNSSDCGLFVLEYIEQFLKNADNLVKKVFESPKQAFVDWFPTEDVKDKRRVIRDIIISMVREVSTLLADKLETLIDDSKESDSEDRNEIMDEIGIQINKSSDTASDSTVDEVL